MVEEMGIFFFQVRPHTKQKKKLNLNDITEQ